MPRAGPSVTEMDGSRHWERARNPEEFFAVVTKFRDMLKEAGRDPASCPVSLSSAPGELDLLKRCRDLGIVRVNVALQAATTEEALPIIDKWAGFIGKV